MRTQDEDGYWEAEVERLRKSEEQMQAIAEEYKREVERLQLESERWHGEADLARAEVERLRGEVGYHCVNNAWCWGVVVENEQLRYALERAAEDIESWGQYADVYFQEKWDLAGDIAAARNALAKEEA